MGKHVREVREQGFAAKGTFECRTCHGIQALVTPDVPTKQYQRQSRVAERVATNITFVRNSSGRHPKQTSYWETKHTWSKQIDDSENKTLVWMLKNI